MRSVCVLTRSLILGALWPLILLSCNGISLPQAPSQIVYELDLKGTIDGIPWQGVAVGSDAEEHDIKIESQTDVNYMTIQSCHRFEKYEDVIETGWFKINRGFEYFYTMAHSIEDTGLCVLRLSAFSKQVGAGEAYGLMLFHNKNFTLPATNICNGAEGQASGTSMCQSMAGLVQRLKFKVQVLVAGAGPDGNPIAGQCQGKFIDATTFEYKTPLGECTIAFETAAKPRQLAVHLVYGFNRSQYRGSK